MTGSQTWRGFNTGSVGDPKIEKEQKMFRPTFKHEIIGIGPV